MQNANSSLAQQQQSPGARSFAEERQSYFLLAVGILIAVAVPYLLRPRAAVSSVTRTTATANAHPSTADQ